MVMSLLNKIVTLLALFIINTGLIISKRTCANIPFSINHAVEDKIHVDGDFS